MSTTFRNNANKNIPDVLPAMADGEKIRSDCEELATSVKEEGNEETQAESASDCGSADQDTMQQARQRRNKEIPCRIHKQSRIQNEKH